MKLVFFTISGRIKGVSYGHFFRCLHLAEEFIRRGEKVYFSGEMGDLSLRILKEMGIPIVEHILEDAFYVVDVRDFLRKGILEELSFNNIPFGVIDDTGDGSLSDLPCKFILNETLCQKLYVYKGKKLFLGPKYHIFPDAVLLTEPWDGGYLFVSFGSSDPFDLWDKFLPVISRLKIPVLYFIPPGLEGKTRDGIKKGLRRAGVDAKEDHFYKWLSGAKVVLSTGGRTPYEATFLGKPVIIYPTTWFERETAIEFAKLGGGLIIEDPEDLPFCLEYTPALRDISQIYDGGKGKKYIADYIISLGVNLA